MPITRKIVSISSICPISLNISTLKETLYFPLQKAHSLRKGGERSLVRDTKRYLPKGSNSANPK